MLARLTVALLVLAPAALAQSKVWTVGGAQPHFTDVQSAIDAASAGDTLLVRAGSYNGILLDGKALSIAADSGTLVVLQGQSEIRNLPAATSTQFVGLQFIGLGGSATTTAGVFAHDNAGSLRFSACTIRGGNGKNGAGATAGREAARISRCEDVALIGVTLRGGDGGGGAGGRSGGVGLYSRDTLLALYDCSLAGGNGGDDAFDHAADGGPGGHGYESPDASMFASGSSFAGGNGGNGGEEQTDPFGGGCVHAGAGGNGGHGLSLGSQPPAAQAPHAQLQAGSRQGGAGGIGGQGYACPSGPNGVPGVAIQLLAGSAATSPTPARSLLALNPARESSSVPLTIRGVPGDRVWMLQSLQTHHSGATPFEGRQLVSGGIVSRSSMLGVLPASGQLASTLALGALPLGVETRVLQLQLLAFDTASAGVWGGCVPLVILDSSY